MGRDCSGARAARRAIAPQPFNCLNSCGTQIATLRVERQNAPAFSRGRRRLPRDVMMCSGSLTPFVRKLGCSAALLAVQLAWTASASAACGDYLQSQGTMVEHLPSGATRANEQASHSEPRPQSPCRGIHCSQRSPLAPAPVPVKVQTEDQPCWFTANDLSAETQGFAKLTPDDEFRLPECRAARLDRPPRAA